MADTDNALREFLSNYPALKLAILFGSQAAGAATPDSDVDLALLADEPLGSALLLDMTEAAGVQFGRPFDIIDLYYAPEPLLGQVLKGRRLLGDNATYAALLTRHLLNAADFLPLQQRILKERRDAWIK